MGRFLLILGLAFPSFATADDAKFMYCRLGKIVRTIRAEATVGGCRTVYTKAGIDRIVGVGKAWSSCHSFLRNVQGNLEGASWNCRELDNYEVVGSAPIQERKKAEPKKEEPAEEEDEQRNPSGVEPQAGLKME